MEGFTFQIQWKKKASSGHSPFFQILLTAVQNNSELYLMSIFNKYVIDGYACSLVFNGQNALLKAIEIADMQKYQRRKEVNKCGGYSETSTVHTTHHVLASSSGMVICGGQPGWV